MTAGQKNIIAILSYGFALVLIYDYVLAQGGYLSILPLPYLSIISVPVVVIWSGYKGFVALANRKWVKSFLFGVVVAVVLIVPKIIIPILATQSQNRAFRQVKEFLLSQRPERFTVTFWGEKNPQLENDFKSFLAHPDVSAVKLWYSFPPHGRYDYIIRPNSSPPFDLTFWESDKENGNGGRIMISPLTKRQKNER